MSNQETKHPDWLSLPTGVVVRPLWEALHDGELCSCESDLLNRTLLMHFEVGHLTETNPALKFEFQLNEVTSVRANTSVRWPGEFVRPNGISREEESRLIAEYQSKWREESLSWELFESALVTDPLQIYNAKLAVGPTSQTLKMQGWLDGDRFDDLFCEIFVRFNQLSILTSENKAMTLDEFDQLGQNYWASFRARRDQKTTGVE